MLNKLLAQQVQSYFGSQEKMPETLHAFLEQVNETYNNLGKKESINSTLTSEILPKINNSNDFSIFDADELKKAHSELGRILNSVNQGFFSRDKETNQYIYLSKGCEKIYGYAVQDFYENSMLWYKVIHPEDKAHVEKDEERLFEEVEVLSQYRIISKDKIVKWIELKTIPHFKNGKLTRIDGVINDISARKKVETERELMIKELLKSNADLKQFSYITSHNLRAPLSNILGLLNMLDYSNVQAHNIDILDMLKESAQQLNETIDDLNKILLIKNNSDPNLTNINIETTFNNVISSFNNALREVGAQVHVKFASKLVVHNKVYLESIFVNLLSNALRYRSLNRNLTIDVSSHEDEAGNVIVSFADNGTGIDVKKHRERIFGLYQRFHSNVDGQGLGLFIVKSQIEAAGGKIDLESEPDKGTTFFLTLKKQSPKAYSGIDNHAYAIDQYK